MLLLWLVLGGCTKDDCAALDSGCAPLYEPTFDEVFDRTLEPSCGVGGGACHAAEGAQGGLILEDADEAWTQLVEPTDASPRVIPGDAACSELIHRLTTDDPEEAMPPGAPLDDGAVCAIAAWIDAGAQR